MTTIIRLATERDAESVQHIYAPIVAHTAISFELEPPTVDEIRARIRRTLERWPWLVSEDKGEILGYAYASEHRTRAAYQWAVDVSAYVHEDHRGKGIGRALYTSLFELLKLQNYCHAYAGIALPNASSVGLHEATGFQLVGIYRSTGYKLGKWHDVGWWHLALQELSANPPLPLSLSQAQELPDWAGKFSAGLTHLRK